MGVAKTVISVAIIGDAKKLIGAIGKADTATGGLLASAGKAFVALAVVDKGFEAVGSILENADRAGDASGRLVTLLGDVDTKKLQDVADSFSDIGVSAPDFLEIAAGFTEFATASNLLDASQITDMAPGVAAFAGALGRLKDVDPATLGDKISNFITGARGAKEAAKELGVPFDQALTPAQRYAQLMERLPGLLNQVTGANAGLDDKQATLNAKWETFGTKVGPGVEAALSGVLDLIIGIVDDIPQLVEDMSNFFGVLEQLARKVASAWATVFDIVGQVADIASHGDRFVVAPGRTPRSGSDSSVSGANTRNADRNGIVRDRIGGP